MSVRQSLLAILDQGPCYGYQLRAEFDRRTGSAWPLNVGQIYNTLERLERDGLVTRGRADRQGHVYWQITEAGSSETARWLSVPVERDQTSRDESAMKLALASTLPGADAAAILATQRAAVRHRLDALPATPSGAEKDPAAVAAAIVAAAQRSAIEAELRWLDEVQQILTTTHSAPLPLTADRPRRGRPTGTTRALIADR